MSASSTPLQAVDLSKKGSEFQATPEELKTIQERMKDPVFMDLLREYMHTLEDPETRREEEAYLEQAEREAREGGDFSFEFIFPRAQFVVELLKPTTTILSAEERQKIGVARDTESNKRRSQAVRSYINICASDKVEACREETTGDRMGSHWHVPVSVSQKRVEFFRPLPQAPPSSSADAAPAAAAVEEAICYIYDAVFHPNTLALVERSNKFLCFLVEIAVEHINAGYHESNGFEFTRLPSRVQSIGQPQNQTVRTKGGRSPFAAQPDLPVLTHPQRPAPATRASTTTTKEASPSSSAHPKTAAQLTSSPASAAPRLPPHTIAHRGQIDMTEAWQWKVVDRRVGVPEALVVKMTFEGVQKASALDVDITEDGTAIELRTTPQQTRHAGLIVLPFTVQPTPVSAKFERGSGVLTLVLTVVPPRVTAEAAALKEEVVRQTRASPLNTHDGEEVVERSNATRQHEEHEAPVESSEVVPTTPPEPKPEAERHAVEESEAAPAATATAPAAPVTDHIQDNERVQAMMAKVQAARLAREAAADHATQDGPSTDAEPKREREAPPADETAGAATAAPLDAHDTEASAVPVEVTKDAPEAVEAMPFITKRDVAAEEEEAALQARQEAWRKMVQEQLDAIAAAEAEALSKAEEDAAREAAKTKKKAELAKQQEAAELKAMEKVRALPLSNKHIFAIE